MALADLGFSPVYKTLVIDPPWPMKKIARNCRPNQVEMDYSVMSLEEICQMTPENLADPEGSHLYLWTTHKFLEFSFELVRTWGFNFECLMTWRKNVGFTPYSWMRSTEHVLFARRGNIKLERLGLRLDFEAKVREHSRKPEEFYDLVRLASPGPRIDIFAREAHEGFDAWGNEVGKF